MGIRGVDELCCSRMLLFLGVVGSGKEKLKRLKVYRRSFWSGGSRKLAYLLIGRIDEVIILQRSLGGGVKLVDFWSVSFSATSRYSSKTLLW